VPGYKVWTREVLSRADLQDLIQDQVVLKYASAAAFDAAVATNVRDGMVRYLDDARRLELRAGGAWRPIALSPTSAIVAPWTEPAGQFGPSPSTLTQLTVPYPGYPFRISAVAHCELGSAATGTRWDMWLRVTGGGVGNFDMDFTRNITELTNFQRLTSNVTDQVFTSACTVIVEARRAYGSANGNITGSGRRLHVNRWSA
jgi:hypothetical protein